jgi:two-component system response regulator YesN
MEKPEQGQSADELLSIWLTEKKQAAVIPLRQRLDKEWKRMACGGHLFHLFLNHAGNSGEAGIEPLKERLQALPCALNETAVVLPNGADSVFLLCGKEHLDVCKNELLEMKLNNPLLEWRSEESIRDASAWLAAVHKMHRLRQIELQTELHTRIHKDDILQAIDFIDQHLHMDIRASELANKIGVSRSYFSTIFKEATGSSLITFISDRKVNRAKELLRVTNLRTDEVAEQVGIQDVKYFSKWFKKCVSQTPSQYRVQTK